MDGLLLEGKRAVVSAGARGMGRAAVLKLASQGADVAFCDITDAEGAVTEADARALSGPHSFYQHCDMGDKGQIDAFIAEVLRRFDHVDVLVNVVGVNDHDLLVDYNQERMDRMAGG